MRLHEFERSMKWQEREQFHQWKQTHSSTIYKLKVKHKPISEKYSQLNLQDKIEIYKADAKKELDLVLDQEQLIFENAVVELYLKTATRKKQ